jgi:PHP family Zn ribbon phosphoesterase
MEGCAEDFSDKQNLNIDSMSKWRKARIDEVQVGLSFHGSMADQICCLFE